jgi:hypothetical protein
MTLREKAEAAFWIVGAALFTVALLALVWMVGVWVLL